MLTLVASALAGGDCIDDADALRAGGTSSVPGCTVKAPSTLGTAQLPVGPCRQLDEPGAAGPGLGRRWWTQRRAADHLDSTICETYRGRDTMAHRQARLSPAAGRGRWNGDVRCPGCARASNTARGGGSLGRVRHAAKGHSRWPTAVSTPTPWSPSVARRRSASPSPSASVPACAISLKPYPRRTGRPSLGAADVAETAYTPFGSKPDATPVRLIVRRPAPGSQLALFASYSYHGFITDRDGDTLELEADHRRHAEVENAIRDLKYGVGLNHLPSGRFAANAAWLAVQVLAHNLARWAARIGLGEQLVTTKTLRRRFFSMAGRLTRSARRLTLHLPRGWPWAEQATLGPDCEPSHSQPDGAIQANRPNASKLASARSASASCCVRSHYHAIPSLHRPLSRPGPATENPLPCHIGPNGAQAFSLVGSLIPIRPALTPPIGGFGLNRSCPECFWQHGGDRYVRGIIASHCR